ncbi:hypothetical protein [Streptosporangium sp. NPDC000396]|uniref:hypothetical protein n=1 Tax=Streptosporangium sp. NPDC000396 TaxID=3366185 RepID=UPI003689B3D1
MFRRWLPLVLLCLAQLMMILNVTALARMLPHQSVAAPRPRLDVLGALLVTASSGVLIYAITGAGDHGWLTATTGWLVLAAAVGHLTFVAR